MLIDILQKITNPLSKKELAEILYSLIYSRCSDRPRTSREPYNQLKPVLNEQFTLVFIKSLDRNKEQFQPNEISGILVYIYRYSHVSNYSDIACLQPQPHVAINITNDGKYCITYETFDIVGKYKKDVSYMNDFKFISQPIEYIEKPCIVDINRYDYDMDEAENLYSYEKCDQLMAFKIMLAENAISSTTTSQSSPSNQQRPATSSAMRNRDLSRTSKNILSKSYLLGYTYYGINLPGGNYLFDKM